MAGGVFLKSHIFAIVAGAFYKRSIETIPHCMKVRFRLIFPRQIGSKNAYDANCLRLGQINNLEQAVWYGQNDHETVGTP